MHKTKGKCSDSIIKSTTHDNSPKDPKATFAFPLQNIPIC